MTGAFGLLGDHHPRVPHNLMVEGNPRVDVWHLLQCGGLVEGSTIQLAIRGTVGGPRPSRTVRIRREAPNLWIDETRVVIAWDEPMPGVGRPWFECPVCSRRCRHVYLHHRVACRTCSGPLRYAVRHSHRQTPGVYSIRRWRRQIGAEERPFGTIPWRPRNHVRFHRVVAQIHAEEAKLVAYLSSIVYDLNRRLRGRRGPKGHDPTKATP